MKTSETTTRLLTFALKELQKEKREKKAQRTYLKKYLKNFPNLGKDIQVQEAQNPKQDETKEVYIKTHYN